MRSCETVVLIAAVRPSRVAVQVSLYPLLLMITRTQFYGWLFSIPNPSFLQAREPNPPPYDHNIYSIPHCGPHCEPPLPAVQV